jgi:cytochrome c peroxidase
MRRSLCLLLLAAACSRDGTAGPPAPASPRAAEVRAILLDDLDRLDAALAGLEVDARAALRDTAAAGRARASFLAARMAYKRVEHLVELYAPSSAEGINGPPIDEVEEDDPNRFVVSAEGFQVIEEMLYPRLEADGLPGEVAILRANALRVRGMAAATPLDDAAVFDALRQQTARIAVLGLAGFDAPLAGRSVPEAAQSLRAMRAALAPYRAGVEARAPAAWRELDARIAGAVAALDANPDFATFDRLAFITDHLNPLAVELARARALLGIAVPADRRAWRASVPSVFGPGAFDALAFAPGGAETTAERVALGRTLFFDPILSGGGARSCASCHHPERGFSDGRARSLTIGNGATLRNAPSLINAGLQAGSFHDLRTTFLEDQVAEVVRNPDEMHGDFAAVAARLRESPEYAAGFRRAFAEDGVSEENVRAAVAAYVRSLQGLGSPFDRYLRGERSAMGEGARRGFNLFMGKAKCGTCHFAPLFNGTIPPAYTRAEVEVLGVPVRATTRGARVDPDSGRARITRSPLHLFAFKTPTVRNVELTAPYMHNGAYPTLESVLDFYDRGGGAGIGAALEHQTLPSDPLRLTAREKSDLVAFMRALTDTAGMTARPASLPRFPHTPHLDRRRVGGAY